MLRRKKFKILKSVWKNNEKLFIWDENLNLKLLIVPKQENSSIKL